MIGERAEIFKDKTRICSGNVISYVIRYLKVDSIQIESGLINHNKIMNDRVVMKIGGYDFLGIVTQVDMGSPSVVDFSIL